MGYPGKASFGNERAQPAPPNTVHFNEAAPPTKVDRGTSPWSRSETSVPGEGPRETEKAYPTDAHVRANAKRQEREKDMTPEEKKNSRQRLPQSQEQHFDDCGSDTEPLERGLGTHTHTKVDCRPTCKL